MSATASFDPPAAVGVESTLTVWGADGAPKAGAAVHLVHRPGLVGAHEVPCGLTDGRGQVKVTPTEAGTVVVRAADELAPAIVYGPPSWSVALHLAALLVFAWHAARRPLGG